jgi:hypothetical protein
MEVDLRKPIERAIVVSAMRQICGFGAAAATTIALLSLGAWLIWRQPWMSATAGAFFALLAWEIYPRTGIRYRTGLLGTGADVRRVCTIALQKAFLEETPIQDWHAVYFKIIEDPSDGSDEEYVAASWIFTYALLRDDLPTAARFMERQLAILPAEDSVTRYIGLGDALHFYTAVMPNQGKASFWPARSVTSHLRNFRRTSHTSRQRLL